MYTEYAHDEYINTCDEIIKHFNDEMLRQYLKKFYDKNIPVREALAGLSGAIGIVLNDLIYHNEYAFGNQVIRGMIVGQLSTNKNTDEENKTARDNMHKALDFVESNL